MIGGTQPSQAPVQRKVCSPARRDRSDVSPQALSFDLDVDVAASRLASHDDLLQTIPPDLCPLTEARGSDEEGRGQPSRGENVASLPAVIHVAVVKRDRDLGPGAVRIPQRHNVAPSAQDIALLREPIRAYGEFVRIAVQLSHTMVEEDQRTLPASPHVLFEDAGRHHERELPIERLELLRAQLFGCQSVEERGAREDVAVGRDVARPSDKPVKSHSKPVFVTRQRS